MRAIATKLGQVLIAALLCHLALLVLSLWLYPVTPSIETARFRETPYPNLFRAAVNGALENGFRDGDQLVVIGPSNALGFRPAELMSLLPDVRSHNLGTPSMRVDEMRHMLELVWSAMPPEQHRRSTLVLTLIFASFPHPKSIYGRREAGIAGEILRTASFRQEEGSFTPRWGSLGLRLAAWLRRPFALVDVTWDNLKRRTFGLSSFLGHFFRKGAIEWPLLEKQAPADKFLFPPTDDENSKKGNLAYLQGLLNGHNQRLGMDQFTALERIYDWADDVGADLVLVGMPVPEWVREGLPFFEEYRTRIEPLERRAERSARIRFVDLHDADLPLWDSTHPHPDHTDLWAAALVEALSAEQN